VRSWYDEKLFRINAIQVDVERYTTVNPLVPVAPRPDSALLGSWALAYASNGVGVSDGEPRQSDAAPLHANILAQVRPTPSLLQVLCNHDPYLPHINDARLECIHTKSMQMLHIADSIPGLGMEAITQNLGVDPNRPGVITMQNSTVFRWVGDDPGGTVCPRRGVFGKGQALPNNKHTVLPIT
jgi:hypothetical protein